MGIWDIYVPDIMGKGLMNVGETWFKGCWKIPKFGAWLREHHRIIKLNGGIFKQPRFDYRRVLVNSHDVKSPLSIGNLTTNGPFYQFSIATLNYWRVFGESSAAVFARSPKVTWWQCVCFLVKFHDGLPSFLNNDSKNNSKKRRKLHINDGT